MNPLLQKFTAPYSAPPFDRIKTDHFIPAIKTLIDEAEQDIARISGSREAPAFENTIAALEQVGEQLGIVSHILFNLNQAETDKQLQQVAQEASPLLTGFSNRLMMNELLFERVRKVYEKIHGADRKQGKDYPEGITTEQVTVTENWYLDFTRHGALLNKKEKERFAAIQTRLAQLTLEFADHVLAETNDFQLHLTREEDLAGLPGFVRSAAAAEAKTRKKEGWVFTLHAPSYIPFLKYSERRELREQIYRAYVFRCNRDNAHDNKNRVIEIVNLRLEQARLMNEPDYASYRLRTKMAENPVKVMELLSQLHTAAQPVARAEFREVQDFARRLGADYDLQPWDWAFYAERLKEQKFGFNEEMLKPYFELERVIRGVFLLAEKLYGLQFTEVYDLPVYHPDVSVYRVTDADGSFLALFYADFFPRPGKQGGAWMTEFRPQSRINGEEKRPHISIVCNFTKPVGDQPSLLTFNEVNTFLHEFGHALHGMLSKVIYPSVSGTGVYQDFVELPSQLMENWMVEKEWLDLFAEHFETGEKIPQELLDKLIAARNWLEGYATERQLGFGYADMAWHTLTEPFAGDVIQFEQEQTEKTRILPAIPGTGFTPAFSHIFAGGYAAGYYGYKWAEVLDADAFSMFKEKGVFNREVAASFRKNILEKGGSEHPMVLYKRFRGKEPTIQALLKRSGLLDHQNEK